MICNKCGQHVPDGTAFCTNCGTPLQGAPVDDGTQLLDNQPMTPPPVQEPVCTPIPPQPENPPMGGAPIPPQPMNPPMGGTPIPPQPMNPPMGGAPIPPQPMNPPMGGAPIPPQPMNPPMGGAPIPPQPMTPPPVQPAKKSKAGLIIGIVAGVIALIVIIGIVIGVVSSHKNRGYEPIDGPGSYVELTTEEKLEGTWDGTVWVDSSLAYDILDYLEFTSEEIDFADLESMYFIDEAIFYYDGTYTLTINEYETQEALYSYFDTLITDCYYYCDIYGGDLETASTLGEFQSAYADLFGYSTYDEMLYGFASDASDYYLYYYETGTFTVDDIDQLIHFTEEGMDYSEKVDFLFWDDDDLEMTYSDVTVEYTRVY